ncbi:aldo/keto reductase [Actinomadura sp. NBRC 104412]|uniref:aldo/keto reductase n=1 Tax=Actinomadura sp. NBRC 104412 TaxID=3032203 RepID=UPI0024A291DF|nr:aldo/keto reductase [Actinomadura sp. NBRC 104412]GLZ02834.1 aldo/keto reductase [Actinomadura sp. NBRC 104412]
MRDVMLSGLRVGALGLGCMNLTTSYGPVDRDQALAVLRDAFDGGVRFWDTADVYALGDNERLLGEFLATVPRDEVVLATKFGGVRDPETGRPLGVRGDPAYVREACEASLRRLGTDHIDLYYQHLPDPAVPIEETVGAMAELVDEGKVRCIGLSNLGTDQLRAAHGEHPIAAVQNEWNLFYRKVESALVPACAELGIAFVPYSPLGRGVLTGATITTTELDAEDERRMFPRFAPQHARHNAALLGPVHRLAEAHGATPAQIALAWLVQRSEVHGLTVVPIPGTRHPARVKENVAALDLRLGQDDLDAVEGIAGQVSGERLPELPPELRHFMPEIV